MPKDTETTNDRLDEIILHLKRMDRRDRLRMWGGTIRSIIALIPLIIFLWGAWYFYNHTEEVMKAVMNQAASSAADYTKSNGQGMFDKLLQQYK